MTLVPAAGWLSRYERPWLKADVVAGLTAAAVVIPKAMAYATIAGLPVAQTPLKSAAPCISTITFAPVSILL